MTSNTWAHVWVATDTRESNQGALGRVGSDVVVADAQHLSRFGFGAAMMAIPPDATVQEIQLGSVDGAVFCEDDLHEDAGFFKDCSDY